MAGYITSSDLSLALGGDAELQQVIRESTVLETKIAEGIDKAEGIIDSLLAGVDGFPFTTTPEIIKQIAIDLAIYELYGRSWGPSSIPPLFSEKYKQAMDMLLMYAKGDLSFTSSSPSSLLRTPFFSFSRNCATFSNNPRIARLKDTRFL